MRALIDGDILLFEIGFSGEFEDKETGQYIIRSFDFVQDLLDNKIINICGEAGADEPPLIFLTGHKLFIKDLNRHRKNEGLEPVDYKPNFREEIAVTKPYKGTRIDNKPFHYRNIFVYLLAAYDCVVAIGKEADDEMSIYQTSKEDNDTIICSRDKDLRQVPGWHYGWECGKQSSFGPEFVDELGRLELGKDKLTGTGYKFYCAQMLMGDVVDNIPGLPKYGRVKAYKLLNECTTVKECEDILLGEYDKVYGQEESEEHFREQHSLVWMLRYGETLGT